MNMEGRKILVTGGAGFIGSNFIKGVIDLGVDRVCNLDLLSYSGNLANLNEVARHAHYEFIRGDIGDRELVHELLGRVRPEWVVNFAAESHVDRSILDPSVFIQTNINGTFCLLESTRVYWEKLNAEQQNLFRFLHVSTDEVYGSLKPEDPPFCESNSYAPNSPYSASKAASDHLVRSYHHTYGLPVLTTNCSNNYGSYQFPEKLIPLIIHNAVQLNHLPIYGDGTNVRDWLYVEDHCRAIEEVLRHGIPGETYNIGGDSEKQNIEVVHAICDILDIMQPRVDGKSYRVQIDFVKDRIGHDHRYAVNATKIKENLGWQPLESFETGLRKTVKWYLDNKEWVQDVTSGNYREWVNTQYAK